MTTPQETCPLCRARPTHNGLVCAGSAKGCTERLREALLDVGPAVDAAPAAYFRTSRLGGGGSRNDVQPLVFDPRVRSALSELERAVDELVSMVMYRKGDRPEIGGGAGERATWLVGHVQFLRHQVSEADIAALDRFLIAARRMVSIVDRPAPKWFAGICSNPTDDGICQADLYGDPDETYVQCRVCKHLHNADERRAIMRAAAAEQLLTATDTSRALTGLDHPVPAERIRNWASRGQLVARGRDRKGRPTYRVGDVQDLLRQAAERHASRRRRQSADHQ